MLKERKKSMIRYLDRLADDAATMADKLLKVSADIQTADAGISENFAEAIALAEDFIRNANFAQATRLASRYAAEKS